MRVPRTKSAAEKWFFGRCTHKNSPKAVRANCSDCLLALVVAVIKADALMVQRYSRRKSRLKRFHLRNRHHRQALKAVAERLFECTVDQKARYQSDLNFGVKPIKYTTIEEPTHIPRARRIAPNPIKQVDTDNATDDNS